MLNTLIITEENEMIWLGLKNALEETGDINVIGDYGRAEEMMSALVCLKEVTSMCV